MRDFLRRVSTGQVRSEYEGAWGLPDRMWYRRTVVWAPWLSALDFLPRYSLCLLFAAPLLWGLGRLLFDDDYSTVEAEMRRRYAAEAELRKQKQM